MIFSIEQTFSAGQTVTTTGPSTNVIDLGATGTVVKGPAALVRDIGKGEPIAIWIQLDADADDPADTLDVELQVDSDPAFGSPKTVAVAPQITGGSAGDRVPIHYIPKGTDEQYMRLLYTIGGDTPSYTLTAGIVAAAQDLPAVGGV